MVIDDDPAIPHLLRVMLEVEGHTVLEAEDVDQLPDVIALH